MKPKLLTTIISIFLSTNAFSQVQDSIETDFSAYTENAPVPIEAFAGNKGLYFQMIVSKQFLPTSRFGFFNVTSFNGNYKEKEQSADLYSQAMLTAQVWKGISLVTGLSAFGSSVGTPLSVRPTVGFQYLFANRKFLAVIVPRFDLTQTYNFETFVVFEYKSMLSENWGIYTRVQGLFNYNMKSDFHEISNIYLRVGLSYKNFQFGIGSNFDFYGPDYSDNKNLGVFVKTDIF